MKQQKQKQTLRKSKSKKLSINVLNNTAKADLKVCDTGLSAFSILSGSIYQMNPIQVGTNYNERIANKVRLRGLTLKYIVRAGSALVGSNNAMVRVIIFVDRRQIAYTAPVSSDVVSLALPNTTYNYFNLGRFSVMHDSFHFVDTYHATRATQLEIPLDFISKYADNSLSSINLNGLYLMLITDNSTNAPTFDYASRVFFEDL